MEESDRSAFQASGLCKTLILMGTHLVRHIAADGFLSSLILCVCVYVCITQPPLKFFDNFQIHW